MVATTDGRILEFATSSASGRPELRQERAFDVSDELPGDDCLVALMPDWAGLIWFVTQDGRVGTVEPGDEQGVGAPTSTRASTTPSRSTSRASTS